MHERLVRLLAVALSVVATSAWGAAGRPDPSFGAGGIVITPVLEYSHALSIVRLPDGRLLVGGEAGQAYFPYLRDMLLARFASDGTLDATFGTDGVVLTPVGTRRSIVRSVLLQPDGKVVVAGTLDDRYPGADIVLARHEADGALDATFGVGGLLTLDLGGTDRAWGAALQPDGAIVVVGTTEDDDLPGGQDGVVLRVDDTGALDPSFGTGGIVLLDQAGRLDELQNLLLEPGGRIVVTGWSTDPLAPSTGASTGVVMALDDDGTPDATFGTGGVTEISVDVRSHADSIARLSDGDLLIQCGGSPGDGTGYTVLVRLNADGTFDGGFGGGDGIISPSQRLFFAFEAMPDDRVLAAGPGFLWGHWGAIGVGRLRAAGTLDESFGDAGLASAYPGTGAYYNGGGLALVAEPDGSAVTIAGFFSPVPIDDIQIRQLALARFTLGDTACASDAECAVCERCGTTGTCERGPRAACVRPDPRGAKITYAGGRVKPKILWKWRSGVSPAGFDPTAGDDLALCMWWGRIPLYESTIPAGTGWIATPAGVTYRDRAGSAFGIQQVVVARKRIFLKAKGEAIEDNPNGFPDALLQPGDDTVPLEVQLHASNGACFAATYPQASMTGSYPRHVRTGVGH